MQVNLIDIMFPYDIFLDISIIEILGYYSFDSLMYLCLCE